MDTRSGTNCIPLTVKKLKKLALCDRKLSSGVRKDKYSSTICCTRKWVPGNLEITYKWITCTTTSPLLFILYSYISPSLNSFCTSRLFLSMFSQKVENYFGFFFWIFFYLIFYLLFEFTLYKLFRSNLKGIMLSHDLDIFLIFSSFTVNIRHEGFECYSWPR